MSTSLVLVRVLRSKRVGKQHNSIRGAEGPGKKKKETEALRKKEQGWRGGSLANARAGNLMCLSWKLGNINGNYLYRNEFGERHGGRERLNSRAGG